MYGKIYESLFTGSMVGSGPAAFAVWGYVIANTKPDSLVELNPIILSTVIGAPTDQIEKAIEFLCSPDPKSRSKQYEGRRMVKKGEFLYFIPRYQHYRGLPNDEARKQYFRDKQREHRQRQTGMLNSSNKHKAEEEAEAEAKKIYDAYPRKVAKPKALKAIRKALRKITPDLLLARTLEYAKCKAGSDANFIPHPATWFNDERFNDDPSTWKVATDGRNRRNNATNRNEGTLNAGRASAYRGVGKV